MAKMYREGDKPIPGYQLVHFLGEGGFGEVWKAINESKIEVALKIVNLQGKQSLREVFAIRKLRNVRHPNLIPILGFWLKDEAGNIMENAAAESMAGFMLDGQFQFFVSMGLAEKTLMDRLKECQADGQAGIPFDELLEYMDESARALDFLNTARHDMGGHEKVSIEHCDIKPQNILLVGGSVQICDFGLARIQQQGTKQNQTTSFSHNYVAPEMLQRDVGPGRFTDQYSLAISYVQLRTGKLPFGDTSFAPAILTAHLEGRLDYSMLMPNEAKIVRKATALRPEDRYPTTRAFVDALKEIATTQSRPMKQQIGIKGPLRTGTEIVPGYKLEALIGRGSFGEVWRATAPGRLRKAIKIIRNLELASSRQELRSLDLITEVRHPYLIQIEACFLLDKNGDMIADEARDDSNAPKAETLVIVSELADSHLGKRLQDCLDQTGQGLPPKELLSYMRHVAVALDRLNETHDIIHRDVKPENILLVGDIAKLADFGLAKALEGSSATIHTKSIGMTPAYAAPELCNGRIEKATDQYSLALTYYHLRTGRLATGDVGDLSELLRAHLHNKLDFNGTFPVEAQVLRKACSLKSTDRFPNCAAFVKALMASFSSSDLPKEAKPTKTFSSVESMEEMPALSAMGWASGTAGPQNLMAVQAQPVVKTDTVDKLTDTARETVAKAQRSTKKDASNTCSTAVRPPARRRRSRVAQVIVTLILLTVVCGIAAGLYYATRQGPKATDVAATEPVKVIEEDKEKGKDKEKDKTKSDDPSGKQGKSQPDEPEKKKSDPNNNNNKMKEPARPTAAELSADITKALQEKDPKRAAEALLELNKRVQDKEIPFAPATLDQVVQCFALLPEQDLKRSELKIAYASHAEKQLLSKTDLLKADGEIDWTGTSKLVDLVHETQPWVQVFHIEKLLHQPRLNSADESKLQQLLQMITAPQLSELGAYGHYLQGAIAWQLKDTTKAVNSFSLIDKTAAGTTWTPARQSRIVDALKTKLDDHKQKAFQLSQWQSPIASSSDAGQYANLSKKVALWSGTPPNEEDLPLTLLAESEGKLAEDEARALLAKWQTKALTSPLQQAMLYRQLKVQQAANDKTEARLPVALQLYTSLQQKPSLQMKPQDAVNFLDNIFTSLGSLEKKEDFPLSAKVQLAQLFAARGRLVVENSLAPWVKKDERLKTALADFENAINCCRQKLDTERNGYVVYHAWLSREMKRRDWATGIRMIHLSNTPGHAQPILLLLQGWTHLQQASLAKEQSARLQLVKKAQDSFKKLMNDYKSVAESKHWVNLAKLGASQAFLENANYLEISDREDIRKDCRNQLEQAEKLAREVVDDANAAELRPEANMALGNALEDFGLLLNDPHHTEAIRCFTHAINAWTKDPLLPRALVNRARAMIRSEDQVHQSQIAQDLTDALNANPDGDVASEIHYWRADQQWKAGKFGEARNTLDTAAKAAKSDSFRDEARCSLVEATMQMPLNRSNNSELKRRIREITDEMPRPNLMDPQIRPRALHVQANALNELANLCFLLMKNKDELEHFRPQFLEHVKNLENATDPVAKWHAAKQRGKLLIMQGNMTEAWKALDMNNQFSTRLGELEKLSPRELKRMLPAFLPMINTRYSLLISSNKQLKDKLEDNIALLERQRKLLPRNNVYAPLLIGYAGLVRWTTCARCPEIEKPTLDRYKTEAMQLLDEAFALAPNDLMAWRWLYARASFESNRDKQMSLLKQSLQLLKSLPETEISTDERNSTIEAINGHLNK
jgi:serine/threonine protein kinase